MIPAISVHVGLNRVDAGHYGSPRILQGCRNDADAMARVAAGAGIPLRHVLLDEAATAANLRALLAAAASQLAPDGLLLLTYAGHGAQLRDAEVPGAGIGGDEPGGNDEAFCLFDRMLRDDELCGLLADFGEAQRVVLVVDSCHAGSPAFAAAAGTGAGTGPGPAGGPLRLPRWRGVRAEVARRIREDHAPAYAPSPGRRLARRTELRATVLWLTACRDQQATPDGRPHGEFTRFLLEALDGMPASYDALREAMAAKGPTPPGGPILHAVGPRAQDLRAQPPFRVAPLP